MHEYGITEKIIHSVCKEADKAGAAKVTDIFLVVGELSSILDDSVQMYFDILSKGTVTEGAKLHFKRISAEFKCEKCGAVFERSNSKAGFECPVCCGASRLQNSKGKEFYIESIEIECNEADTSEKEWGVTL